MTTRPKKTPEGELVLAGVVGAAHGIKGEVRFHPKLENTDLIEKEGVLFTSDKTPFLIALWRQTAKGVLVGFKHTPDRNAAEKLRGVALYLDGAVLPPLAQDEFYYKDLTGLMVKDHQNQDVGLILEVFYSGAQHILVIQHKSGQEVLVPFMEDTVADVSDSVVQLTQEADMFLDVALDANK